jgi:DDE domain
MAAQAGSLSVGRTLAGCMTLCAKRTAASLPPSHLPVHRVRALKVSLGRALAASAIRQVSQLRTAVSPPPIKQVLPNVDHPRHKGLNIRAENSHLPVRKRERVMQRFKSTEHVQTFLSVFGPIGNHFRPRRHRLSASQYRLRRAERFATWRQAVGLQVR